MQSHTGCARDDPGGGPPPRLVEEVRGSAGLNEIVIKGERVTLRVVPEAGGKIWSLIENLSGFELLWRNPRVKLARTYAGAPFDDLWCGGWDDIFPTDPPCTVGDNSHHDHGDFWIAPWSWSIETETTECATVHLSQESVSLPCRVDKWITLARTSNEVRIKMRLTNLGTTPFQFMWNQHVAHAIEEGSRVHLPASRLGVVGRPDSLGVADTVHWPRWNGSDLSQIPGREANVLEFLYARDLREGWCAVTHPRRGVAVKMSFDPHVFATPWLWRVFGGWRGHHLLLTELCTSQPGSLADAIANGSAARLDASATLETEIRVLVSTEFDPTAPGNSDPLGKV